MTVLVVGLGGGSLPTYLHQTFPLSNTHVVEHDEAVARVARDQFGFAPDDRLTMDVADGLEYVRELSQTSRRCGGIWDRDDMDDQTSHADSADSD